MDDIDVLAVEVVEDIVGNLVLFKIFEIIGGCGKAKEFYQIGEERSIVEKGNQGRNGAADVNSCFNSIPGSTALRSSSYCGKLSLT